MFRADHGKEQKPFANGPTVRAVDLEIVRQEFYRCYPAEGATEGKKQSARRQAFHRCITHAQASGVVGVRVVEGITLVWPVALET